MKKRRPGPRRAEPQETAAPLKRAPSWRGHAARIAILWAALFAAYSNSFQAGLTFDNGPVIGQDLRIRAGTAENVRAILGGQYWFNNATSGLYRPLTTLSYLANYAVLGNGADPAGYHWVNLALDALNAALVYALGVALFGDAWMALALASIWALHPLLTESVTNIVGRADLLAGLGVFAGLLSYVRSQSAEGARRATWLAALMAAQTIGLFSKESAAVLPGLMFAFDLAWPDRTSWKRRAPAYALLAAPLALFLYLRAASHAKLLVNFQENPLITADFFTARLTAITVISKFLWRFVWPASLSADYSYDAVPLFGSSAEATAAGVLALAICAGLLVMAIRARPRWPALAFFIAFFFVAALPTSNLVILIGSIMAERFMYVPLVGLAGAVVFMASKLPGRPAAIAAVIVSTALAARTYARNFDWRDGISLWSSAIAASPNTARAHHNLAFEYTRIPGRQADAIAEYEAALRIRPDYPEAHFNLGNAYLRSSRAQEAMAQFRAAIESAPAYVEARNNLGSALVEAGRAAEAIPEFQAALRIRPDYAEAHMNLGMALAALGRMDDAMGELRSAVKFAPDSADAHKKLGNALTQTHRFADAIHEYRAAIRIQPQDAEAHANLGSALIETGQIAEAGEEYREALRVAPGLADARFNLATVLLREGKRDEAIAELETLMRTRPDAEVRQMLDRLREK